MRENSVLSALTWEAEGGRLAFRGVRYLLIRPETLVALQKAAEAELGARAGALLARGGRAGGALSARRYREELGLDPPGVVEFMLRMGQEIGWGAFTLDRLDLDGRVLLVSVRGSPFAEAYGPAAAPVCHLIAGVVAGLAEGIFDRPATARESACLAAGSPACRFEARAEVGG